MQYFILRLWGRICSRREPWQKFVFLFHIILIFLCLVS